MPSLTECDMLVAVDENTINFQFYELWGRIERPKKELSVNDGTGASLAGVVQAPVISISDPTLEPNCAWLNFKLDDVKFTYNVGSTVKSYTQSLTFVCKVTLAEEHISYGHIEQNKYVSSDIKSKLKPLESPDFSILSLLLTFGVPNIEAYNQSLSKLGGLDNEGIQQLVKLLTIHFTSLMVQNTPYIISLTPTVRQAVANSEAIRDVKFFKFSDPSNPVNSSLSYCLYTSTPPPAGHVNLPVNWGPTKSGIDATFVISKSEYWDRHVVPALKNALDMSEVVAGESGQQWHFANKSSSHLAQTVDLQYLTFNLEYSRATSLKFTSGFTSKGEKTTIAILETSAWAQCKFSDTMTVLGITTQLGDCIVAKAQKWSTTLSLTPTSIKNNQLELSVGAINLSPVESTTHKTSLVAIADDIMKNILSKLEGSIAQGQLTENLIISKDISGLKEGFIMLGQPSFFYKNPRLNAYGDVLVDLDYKSQSTPIT